jgi:very-short-patch-repair endonuclease/DNA polymerase III delta prime subunit
MRCPGCQAENAQGAPVCSACGVSLRPPVDADRIGAQLKRWQERLLDLTRANPLLGLNRSRVSKLRVTEPSADPLLRALIAEDAALRMPMVVKITREGRAHRGEDADDEPEYRLDPGDVMFEGKPADLLRRLRRLHDNARTTVQERGVTTLHVSFGVLKWEDPVLGESSSPLWLVPCELESQGPSAPLLLARADEEMQLNPALELFLRERHRVGLPALPEDVDAGTLTGFLDDVQAAVREYGWKVEEQVWLSTYSFESLVLYQDLKALGEVALGNQVVIALSRASDPPEGSEALGEEALDSMPTPEQVPLPVLPVDSSQLKALTVARAGRHLVVHGPPGTGKSQTISNLIADALGKNKKVLFVSAKMAALNVVHDRLARLGLADFCLEAHSTKAGKAKIIEDLRRTLAGVQDAREDDLNERLDDLRRVRDELNRTVLDLHERRDPLGLTVYRAIGKVQKLGAEPDVRGPLPWPDCLTVTRTDLKAALEALADLGSQAEVFDHRVTHPWRGLVVQPGKPIQREAIEVALLALRDRTRILHHALTGLAPLLGSDASELAVEALGQLAAAFVELTTLDSRPPSWPTRNPDELLATAALLDAAAADAAELHSKLAEHGRALRVSIEETLRLLQPVEAAFGAWTGRATLAYWRWRRSLRPHLADGASRHRAALCAYLAVARQVDQLQRSLRERHDILSCEVGPASVLDAEALAAAARRLRIAANARAVIAACGLTVSASGEALIGEAGGHATAIAGVLGDAALKETFALLDEAWHPGFVDGVAASAAPLPALLARCEEVLDGLPRLHEWTVLQHCLHRCRAAGLLGFVDALGSLTARAARGAFERRFYTAWANAALEASPSLAVFAGARREEQVERFRSLDVELRRAALSRIIHTAGGPVRRVASAQGGVGTASEVGILRRELEKRKRIKPLRQLFAEIPTVLQALKPCMLMSPLSVSTFLKPGVFGFDIVVFDEASQLPTPEGIPAILRARQVVVAGDSKQLPPTSFFAASVIGDETGGDENGVELEPLESLLDDCVAIFPVFDHAHLRWHYRSKDERLIKFSNHYFYRERPLITFPPASLDSADRGVRLEYLPAGVWDRGGSRTNRVEARRVAELVVEQLERHPERSLGVVTMNVTQREAVEEALDERVLARPDLAPLLRADRAEPFFIKALENVQGDERDTIIISVGYGKSSAGALSLNFGPLNQDGGWRRLNVVITRARWHTILVTSMRSDELVGVNPNNLGAVHLKNFIVYAEQGAQLPADPAVPTDEETNDFEDAVAAALRERGLVVDQQVGSSGYRIDLAVRDPRNTARYVLGIECDGATYHSAKTARDRDLLRQEVLRAQGWRLYRVWSTDWFRDRSKATAGILRALEQALAAPPDDVPMTDSPEARATSGPAPDRETPRTSPPPSPDLSASMPAGGSRHSTGADPDLPGEPYERYRERGERDFLLDRSRGARLKEQIIRIVRAEGPVHEELLMERLKEINQVGRAGTNVQENIECALKAAIQAANVERVDEHFLKVPGSRRRAFRTPGDGVQRPLPFLPPEEIELAVLFTVEDQFGYQRDALPRRVAELFGFERTPTRLGESVGSVVDGLVERGALVARGYHVYLP